ncbi:tRNA pseudouridine(13) synthase TruD [soil metagenome]
MKRFRAVLKTAPEDFVVDEIPLYTPSGTGTHLYVRFRKRDTNTDFAVRGIARAIGAEPRDAGVPGMKDRRAVTTQTVSFAIPRGVLAEDFVARARAVAIEGLEILDASYQGNKLRTGHLAGNRFRIRLQKVATADAAEIVAAFERVGREGAPNAFGAQRFGRDGDNADRARAWLSGKSSAPRDHRMQKLLVSSLQSELFNSVLAIREERGDWATPIAGDLLRKEESGGLLLCEDPLVDGPRAASFEVSPTGPIFGSKMMAPAGIPLELEQKVLRERLGDGVDLAKAGNLAEGTRRAFRVPVAELRAWIETKSSGNSESREEICACRVEFVLPKGAFATTVVGCFIDDAEDPGAPPEPPGASEA